MLFFCNHLLRLSSCNNRKEISSYIHILRTILIRDFSALKEVANLGIHFIDIQGAAFLACHCQEGVPRLVEPPGHDVVVLSVGLDEKEKDCVYQCIMSES